MNRSEQQLLEKLGIMISGLEYEYPEPSPYNGSYGRPAGDVITTGNFMIDDSKFGPMCRLIHIVDMICESKNPAVNKQFEHLLTMLELTKDNKNG